MNTSQPRTKELLGRHPAAGALNRAIEALTPVVARVACTTLTPARKCELAQAQLEARLNDPRLSGADILATGTLVDGLILQRMSAGVLTVDEAYRMLGRGQRMLRTEPRAELRLQAAQVLELHERELEEESEALLALLLQ